MFSPEDIPADVPDEVKLVLAHLEPEPEVLADERERLLTELDTQLSTSQGSLARLLTAMRTVLLSSRPGAEFQPRFAAEFAAALEHYGKEPAAAHPPPGILQECFDYLHEHLQATGMGPLLAALEPDSSGPPPAQNDRLREQLRIRVTLGNIRG